MLAVAIWWVNEKYSPVHPVASCSPSIGWSRHLWSNCHLRTGQVWDDQQQQQQETEGKSFISTKNLFSTWEQKWVTQPSCSGWQPNLLGRNNRRSAVLVAYLPAVLVNSPNEASLIRSFIFPSSILSILSITFCGNGWAWLSRKRPLPQTLKVPESSPTPFPAVWRHLQEFASWRSWLDIFEAPSAVVGELSATSPGLFLGHFSAGRKKIKWEERNSSIWESQN